MIFTYQIFPLFKTVGIYRQKHYVGIYRGNHRQNIKSFLKIKLCDEVKVFVDDFTDGIIVGFKPRCSYNDVFTTPTDLPTKLQTKLFNQ